MTDTELDGGRDSVNQISPFLRREYKPSHRYQARTDRIARDREMAALTLERLRYRWWQRRGSLGCFMQRIGDVGRKYFAVVRFRF